MTETAELVDRVSKTLGVPRDELIRMGVREYLQSQLRGCLAERNELLVKYGVRDDKELEKRIREGTVEEHPAWEDLILLENLMDRADKIREELEKERL